MMGDNPDLRHVHCCAELIQRRAQQLLHCSSESPLLSSSLLDSSLSPPHSHTSNPCCIPEQNSSHLDSVSILSRSQMEHLDFAAQEVMSASRGLTERVVKLGSPENGGTTPRGKRLLPLSPSKLGRSPVLHLQQASARRSVALTSKP